MKNYTLCCGLIVALSAMPLCRAEAAASRFDGDWDVTLSCPKSLDGALAYSYEFPATVKDGVLHGERGTKNEPGWLQLDGPIKDDGSTAMIAEGLTNISAYAINNLKKGTPYKHAVSAQFETSRGTGSWITIRTCDFRFEKKE